MLSTLRERFQAMPVKKQSWLIASLLFLIAAIGGMVWFAERPDWRVSVLRVGWQGCAAGFAGVGCGGNSV